MRQDYLKEILILIEDTAKLKIQATKSLDILNSINKLQGHIEVCDDVTNEDVGGIFRIIDCMGIDSIVDESVEELQQLLIRLAGLSDRRSKNDWDKLWVDITIIGTNVSLCYSQLEEIKEFIGSLTLGIVE